MSDEQEQTVANSGRTPPRAPGERSYGQAQPPAEQPNDTTDEE